ncbi:SDR family oxidoreductase [Legionella rowbothamii]|uniref:SDR family oxidoreductase n=1 Tax=Legionella rowbothamii TaxID=96229 RepID=UPI001056A8BA|nr:SDR family oxidoreductase [Legionella rowbothamii]
MSTNKHAIITGGSSGIGKALAIKLAHQGYSLSIIARDERKLCQAKQEIIAHCSNAPPILTFSADVSKEAEIHHAIEEAVSTQGYPDLLITSAGVAHCDYFNNLSSELFEKNISINYLGSLYAIKAVFPYMKKQKSGHIVLISSGAGLIGIWGYSAYGPSKFAIRGLAEALRPEFKKYGINVSIVYPPDTNTPQLIQEEKTKPIETQRITGTVQPWPADTIADCIVQGIKKNKFHITPGFSIRFLRIFHSPLFQLFNFYFDILVRRPISKVSKDE